MAKKPSTEEKSMGITVKKADDMPEWYSQLCLRSELAEYAPVKGCYVIRPYGYAMWQNLVDYFNARLKALGVNNAYFPLFIPESFFKKESQHAQGFKPEVAWIANKFEGDQERLAIRPTSETIMYDSYSRWIQSHRDLPLKINQWANVVRWETEATKLFLRSREFLWQEGHNVFANEKECEEDTLKMNEEYIKMCKDMLAMPLLAGKKTEKEKFAGAVYTTTIEAFMPDGKALQCGTSHHLGQNFAKSFEITFKGEDEKDHHAWQNSWGVSTRLIGGMVMLHGDDKGLVLPPPIAPIKAVIIPIYFKKGKEEITKECEKVKKMLSDYDIVLDDADDHTPGWKYAQWEMKGVPIRIEIGPKDVEKKQAVLVRRDTGDKSFIKLTNLKKEFENLLEEIHENLYNTAKKFMEDSIVEVKTWDEFVKAGEDRKLIKTNFCGGEECEEFIKEKTKGVSSRCIPFDSEKPKGKCVHCGEKAKHVVFFSKSY